VAGLDVADAAPPVAAIPVSAGIEKYVASQTAGALDVMLASSVNVTTSTPLPPLLVAAATVSGDVNVWALPLVDVE